jgi:glucarate dehydratase
MLALRDAFGPDVPLRLDPNCNWTVESAIEVGKALAGVLEYLEDPVATLPRMAQVRAALLDAGIDMPLGNNMSVVRFADVPEAVLTDATQVVLGDHHYWGGLRAVKDLGRICQTFGLGLSMHSNSHLGISLMAMTHLGAATPHLTYASDTHYPWQDPADEIVAEGRATFVDGAVAVPDGPGLGVTLDQDALARGRERYVKSGLTKRDDAIEMRKRVDQNWERVMPRW